MSDIIMSCEVHGDLSIEKTIQTKNSLQVVCRKCRRNKHIREYNNKPERKIFMKKYLQDNADRIKEYHRSYNQLPEVKRKVNLRSSRKSAYRKFKKYGITEQQFNQKLLEQNYVCAICKLPEIAFDTRQNRIRILSVDHCHSTGVVRGLLCGKCNLSLGRLNEDINVLQAMIDYINTYKTV